MEWNFPEKKNVRKFGNTTQSCRLFRNCEKMELKKEQNGVKPQTKVHANEFCSANPCCVSDYLNILINS